MLVLLIVVSAFFSGSETALLTLNRYRLLHLSKTGHAGAARALQLLSRPDRLIGFILLGNNFVNVLASSLCTYLALEMYGEKGLAIGPLVLTLVLLVFGEVTPKTIAALRPERLALPAVWVIGPLLWLSYPLVVLVNAVSNAVLRLLRCDPRHIEPISLSSEELKTVVAEAGAVIPDRYRRMLLSILDLEAASVRDIMIPRHDIVGIDLDDALEDIVEHLKTSRHHRFPVYKRSIDRAFGILYVQHALTLLHEQRLTKETLVEALVKPTFVPDSTPLHRLLSNFQEAHAGMALIVDEYGEVIGLVTLEDLLQKIVGEFTLSSPDVREDADGTYLIDASIPLRELNHTLGLNLPTEGPVTLNGLIIEYLETIPDPGTSLKLIGHQMEVVKMEGNAVKLVRFFPDRSEVSPLMRR